MLTRTVLFVLCLFGFKITYTQTTAGFTAPDTVCVNTPVNITNTSTNASSYYWNFCTANLNAAPIGANFTNLNGSLTSPVYIDYVQENGNYYGFMTDNYTGRLFRVDFGNSLLNPPAVISLGNFGGAIPVGAEGIQVIKNEGKWYAIIVGGDPSAGTTQSLIRVEFGANITNNTPTIYNWGNIGNMDYSHDLYMFLDAGVWYGLTVNTDNNTITRFNFTNSFNNVPSAVNLGNIGTLTAPTGIYAINSNGNWYAFVTNANSNTLSRLDFGNSLLNTPTGVNLGNVGNQFHVPWDIQVINYCGELLAYVINADQSYNSLIKLNFSSITSTPTATSFGNIGNMRFPHCLSKLFRVGSDLYTFVTNVANQSITRLRFSGCTNASIPNSTSPNPGPVTYNTPGTYNINLSVDDGLPSQTAFCKQVVVLSTPTDDFIYKQDVCNPLVVQFTGAGTLTNAVWDFGDGHTASGTVNPVNTFPGFGNYTVTLTVGLGPCKKTITKTITINVTEADIVQTKDTVICLGASVPLKALPALSFCWQPATYLTNANTLTPTATPLQTTTYYHTAEVPGANLVNNGDFNNGNVGFTSQYTYKAANIGEGEYTVTATPKSWNINLGACTDHTTGTGNMLLVNGATQANVQVWTQTIAVSPNTNYAFSAWLQNANVNGAGSNPPKLQFSINGNNIGNILQGRNQMCIWDQFYSVWNSGNNTTATISIVNQNTVASGNDYALDDISFAELKILRDSVKIIVEPPPVHTPTYTINICQGESVKIGSGIKNAKYTWNTGETTDSIVVNAAGIYWIESTINSACGVRDSVIISVQPKPVVNLGSDITVCALNNLVLDAGAGLTYLWQDGSTAQTFTVTSAGKHYVQVTAGNGCMNSDTIDISLHVPTADFTYKQDVCNPLAVQFVGVGSFINPGWDFGEGNTASGSANAANTYPSFGNYIVKFGVESAGCKDTITKTIDINVIDADIILTKDTIICLGATVPLQTQPALSFCWSPTTYLNNTNTLTPIATPLSNITYYLTTEVPGVNLVKNGDFTNGDLDFTSQYTYTTKNATAGEYTVTADIKTWNGLMGTCTDHTTGTGNMLLVNGATQPNVQVWTQTITITPNTNYAFSAWLQNVNVNGAGSNPSQLQFSINGINIGNILQGSQQMCQWDQFYSVWNSGNNTTATISIVNQNTVASGNDYALDDISFSELKILRDSVKITVETPPVHTPTQQISICSGDNVKIGTGVKNAQYTWNTIPPATTDSIMVNTFGTYWVQTDLLACTNKDTIIVSNKVVSANFTHKQDACNPLIVQFTGAGNVTNFSWDFGDGNTSTGNLNVSHTYPAFNSYTVKFAVEENGCKDTITQTISVNVGIANLILTPDTTICYNASKQLRTQPTLDFCWWPTTWLSDPASPNPVTTTPGNITYYFTAQAPGINLVTNGDFSNGATGFHSDYINQSPNSGEGEYTVGPSSYTWNNMMASCSDHTTGTGNMLIVNGASTANSVIWSQSINAITPNTDYAFVAWLQNVNVNGAASNPATLQFSINGTPLGNTLQSSNTSCVWDRFYVIWNSGSNTSANISIINQNTASAGNDFALDDISFSPVSILRDSVIISVDTPVVITRTDTIVCKNAQIELPTKGAATWAWTPAAGLSSTTISNPIATVDADIEYIVTGTTVNGCTAKDTVNISIHPIPNVITDEELIICPTTSVQLLANNTLTSWLWAPAAGLSNSTISNPVATPDVNTEYVVTGTTVEGCTVKDTVNVNLYTLPTVIADRSLDVCPNTNVQLTANNTLTSWLWTPATGLSNTTISNPVATPDVNSEYIVTGTTSDGCTVKDTININLYTLPTVIADRKLDVCPNTSVQLTANNTLTSWSWTPAASLSNTTISNPVATPDVNTEYIVTGITSVGCTVKDTIDLNLYTLPTVIVDRSVDACFKAPLQLSANNNLRSWLWTPATDLSSTTISNPVVTPAANTEYIVTGITTEGCTVKDTINVNLYPIPTVITNHDITACVNSSVQLSANTAMASWLWTPALYLNNPAIANPTAVPANVTYKVQVKDQYNCVHSDTVRVHIIEPKFNLFVLNRTICQGASVQLLAKGGDAYLWTPAESLNNAAISNPQATPDTSTTYSVYVKENTCGTDTTMQLRVTVNPIPLVEATKANDINCVVPTTRLYASGTPGTAYQWAPVTWLDHPNRPDPVSGPDTTTTYFVTGTNQYGCTATDSVTVFVAAEGKVTFMVPNAFTPNGDGRNDCFGVKSWGGAVIEEFAVFNRWGERVFSSKNATACWDGRYKGELQPSGGYVYAIVAKTFCGRIKRTGTVVLVR